MSWDIDHIKVDGCYGFDSVHENASYAIVGQFLHAAVAERGTGPVIYHPSNEGFEFLRQFRALAAIANQWRFFNDAGHVVFRGEDHRRDWRGATRVPARAAAAELHGAKECLDETHERVVRVLLRRAGRVPARAGARRLARPRHAPRGRDTVLGGGDGGRHALLGAAARGAADAARDLAMANAPLQSRRSHKHPGVPARAAHQQNGRYQPDPLRMPFDTTPMLRMGSTSGVKTLSAGTLHSRS